MEIAAVEIIKAKEGKVKELRKALSELVPICRKGEGCLQYDLYEPKKGSGEFMVLMRWKDPKDLAKHESSKVIEEFCRMYDGLLYDEVKQTEWYPVGLKNGDF